MPERKPTHCMTVYGFRYEYTKAGASVDSDPKWQTTADETAKDDKAVAGASFIRPESFMGGDVYKSMMTVYRLCDIFQKG